MTWQKTNAELARFTDGTPEALRDGLAALYQAIADVPESLLQDFALVPETAITHGFAKRAAAVAGGTIAVVVTGEPRAEVLDAWQLLRAIEANLVEFSRHIESDRSEDLETAWRTADGQHYVVPRLTALERIDEKPFLRRALLHYRVLPTAIGEFVVRLHRSSTVADAKWAAEERAGAHRNYGAAFFPDLKADLNYPDPQTFTVVAVSGCDTAECVSKHLATARAEECYAVVWGELTMPEPTIEAMRAMLASSALEGCGPLRYLVAGSWHTEVEGRMRNQCRVLDGYGEPICEVFKWAKFIFDHKMEAIEPGNEVHIIVGEYELSVVAICRDFLHAPTDLPYVRLNVDVALVPSMIPSIDDRATLTAHAATADTMRVRYGTRTLVVAQPAQAGTVAIGQVLSFPARPLQEGGELVSDSWKLCALGNH
ncbi:MAG: hypothetical protein K5821_15970 [Nitrobacter sp.]|uniref:hypothetical protein n=1 Tax=Nitrobacter sp. TaxID=29420 RepID=UPI0026049E63|nr:hypothetical protein [Nitrobacter sp.]MCV0387866.1 hypothetical protein [Nitrobacter sp.]